MHRWLAGCAAALLGALPATAQTAPADPAQEAAAVPAAIFETTNLDLGKVAEGTDAVGTFTIKNAGTAELKLLQVRPG